MSNLKICLLFFTLVNGCVFVECVNPGLKIRLSQTGLDYAGSVALDILIEKLRNTTVVPYEAGSFNVGSIKVKYVLKDVKVRSIRKPITSITLDQDRGLLTWAVTDASFALVGKWKNTVKWSIAWVKDHGTFEASAIGVSAIVSLTLGMNSTGHPTISSTNCSGLVKGVKITELKGILKPIYALFLHRIEEHIRNHATTLICEKATQLVDVDAKKMLDLFGVQANVGGHCLFDFRLVSTPLFSTRYLESYHKGEFFFDGDSSEAPFEPSPFAQSEPEQMVTVWASDYILNSLGYVLIAHNQLHWNVTKKDLPENESGSLNTSCDTLHCIGIIVPQLYCLYPNASVELEMIITEPPTVEITPSAVLGNLGGLVYFRARLENDSLAELFVANVSASFALVVTFENMTLKGKVENLVTSVVVVESEIGPLPVFSYFFNSMAENLLISKLNEIGGRGIFIPYLNKTRFFNTKLYLESHSIRMVSDVIYTPY